MEYIFDTKILHFNKEVVEIFDSFRQVNPDQHEAGGILLGRVFENKIVIEQVSTPGTDDKSGRYFFDRNVRRAQWFVDMAWRKSKGEVIYLGEWHTHPEKYPSPSSIDKRLISNMLKDTRMTINFLFLVIIGIERKYVAVQHQGKRKPLIQLKEREAKV